MTSADWAAWVGAISTSAATFLVIGGLWWEIHQRRLDQKQLADEARDAQWQQARLITLHATMHAGRGRVEVINDSSGPIRKIRYELLKYAGDQLLGAQPFGQDSTTQGQISVVPAHDRLEFDFMPVDAVATTLEDDLRVHFVDVEGRSWTLTATHDLLRRNVADVTGP